VNKPTPGRHTCNACGKKYYHRQSLHVHKKLCNVVEPTPPSADEIIEELKNTVLEERKEREKHEKEQAQIVGELRTQIAMLLKKQTEITKNIEQKNREKQTEITNFKQKSCEKRKKISKDIRQQIAEKQENACGECKQALTPYFELDHIIGLQFGGTDDESNLMALCRECHGEKSVTENQCRKQIRDAIQTIWKEKRTSKLLISH
jgi:5-methylcytosine-specific restriction endonuclease McrA